MSKISAHIFYLTGIDPDELDDDKFWRYWCYIQYAQKKANPKM